MLGIDKMSPFPLKIFIPARLLSLTGILKISDQDNTLGGHFAIKCCEHSASIFTKRRTEGLYRRCFLGKLSKMDDPGPLLLNSSGRLLWRNRISHNRNVFQLAFFYELKFTNNYNNHGVRGSFYKEKYTLKALY